MKILNLQSNIGSSKYVVSFHDGQKKHVDGSPFFDIRLFKNKIKRDNFTKSLITEGYKTLC